MDDFVRMTARLRAEPDCPPSLGQRRRLRRALKWWR